MITTRFPRYLQRDSRPFQSVREFSSFAFGGRRSRSCLRLHLLLRPLFLDQYLLKFQELAIELLQSLDGLPGIIDLLTGNRMSLPESSHELLVPVQDHRKFIVHTFPPIVKRQRRFRRLSAKGCCIHPRARNTPLCATENNSDDFANQE